MFWDRDRFLLALSTRSLKLSGKPQSHSGLLYKSYADFYNIDMLSIGLAKSQSIQVVPSVEFDLVAQIFEPAMEIKGQVVIVHGYYDHAGLYGNIVKRLLANGLRVVAFDLPGHGLSSGARASIDAFEQYQPALKSILALCDSELPLYLLGQSTGAAILADLLSSEESATVLSPLNLKHVFMLAPLMKPQSWHMAEFAHSILQGRKEYWPRSFKDNSHDQAFLDFVQNKDPLQHDGLSVDWVGALRNWIPKMSERATVSGLINGAQLSLIQGNDDTTVDWTFNLPFYQTLFPLVKVSVVDGAGHHLVGESAEYRQKVFSIIESSI
ncbi:hypothetical protein A3715_01795 [Oleiphilus sp. HI0009]|uniref:alpha/beta hydrolase n=2 Tax=Oleiphilus TaxID=141450 RepID=UPI0007C2A2DA|nr:MULTISPECIES: alpha/beta hydrolase [unclassified Oleiphilus]KZX77514.1 hypothetical protein A3715_01795 [Oleiphilus sp. HI0009]KZY65539.1 hypothetical protein A3738_08550 [Oleiphilus sp. HI0066]KZY67986.1 hypothetical protein A3739_11340 [Oleiphilus sp. HI0067]